jgi:hypothetical protein
MNVADDVANYFTRKLSIFIFFKKNTFDNIGQLFNKFNFPNKILEFS